MSKMRCFISFASEDARIRDLFVGQGKHPDSPWEIADWSLHEPFSEKWKTQTRPRIKQCDVIIQLIGQYTFKAEGAIWEVECGKQEGIPSFGIWINKDAHGPVPSCFKANSIIDWTWPGVAAMINKIPR
jgi:hypothetical protein